nr:hypothetical protein [Alcaligenes faecalis]
MTTETVLTESQIFNVMNAVSDLATHLDAKEIERIGRAVESAVLQSPEVQRLRQDAERMDFIESHRGWLRHVGTGTRRAKWVCYPPTSSYEHDVYDTARAAIDSER